jgi:hypothetical protein
MKWLVVVLVACACGGGRARPMTGSTTPVAHRTADWMLALLPEGAQLVVELDLARLRGNPVVGEVATQALAELGAESRLPGLPISVQGSPLVAADFLVLGAYGVGTAQATTVILLATKADVTGSRRVAADIAVLGEPDWADQVANRAAIATLTPDAPAPLGERLTVAPSEELARLLEHAMPDKAPGAILRVSARLPFDARVAFAQLMGVDSAPAQLSIWADVVDDFAIIIDADAADPGDKDVKGARKRLVAALTRMLASLARDPGIRAVGISHNLADAKLVEQGTWVRAIVQVGPRQLARATQRLRALLAPPPVAPPGTTSDVPPAGDSIPTP